MNKKIRVGIIGTGFGATVHAPLMKNHSGFDVVAISSVYRGNVDKIKQETGISQVYDDWKRMLHEEELDLVSIASAPYLHKEMVLEAIKLNRHIFCEKPMAFNLNEAKEMVEATLNAGNIKSFINFEFRFLPTRLKVKEIFERGKLGKILHINYKGIYQGYHRNFKRKSWLGESEKGGGMLGAFGSHMIDALQWWKHEMIETVYGQLPTHFSQFVDKDGLKEIRTAEDAFQAIGSFKDGTTFNLDFIFSNRNTSGWRLEVHGTGGTLIMTDDKKIELAYGDESLKSVNLPQKKNLSSHMSDYAKRYYGAFHPMLEHLYTAILGDNQDQNLATFKDGYQVQMVLDAIRDSVALGKPIKI